MLQGDTARALHCLRIASETGDALSYAFAQALDAFGNAQIEWHLGRRREAKEKLALARHCAEQAASGLVLYACDLLESDFVWDEDREHALSCLRSGFALARVRGYYNGFWLRRDMMARVTARALDHGIEAEHVRGYITKHRLVCDHLGDACSTRRYIGFDDSSAMTISCASPPGGSFSMVGYAGSISGRSKS